VISEGKNPILSLDPFKIVARRKHVTDAEYSKRDINYKINADYDPLNIYEIKVLPKDEKSLHKFNAATYGEIYDGDPNGMEPPTTYTLPFWLGVYHKMIAVQ
jgi:hypothetical protein